MGTREAILLHCEQYPELEIQDIFKFIFQSACGCEHMVSDHKRALQYIRCEYADMINREPKIDALDGDYSRVHLSCIGEDLSAKELTDMFVRSARHEPDGRVKIQEKLSVARGLIKSGQIKLDLNEFDAATEEWKNLGFPAIHHSDKFKAAYHPAYRVIHNDLLGDTKWKIN